MKCWFVDYIQHLIICQAGHSTEPHSPPLSSQEMKCSFLDYIQLLMIGQAGQWAQIPSTTSLQPKEWNAHFWITFNFWWPGRMRDSNPNCNPSPAKKMKCLFLDYVHHLMIGRAGWLTQTLSATPLQPKDEMLIFGFHSTSDDWQGWSMDLNPNCNPSPAKKWNAHFWIMFNFWWLAGLVNGIKPHLPPLSRKKMKCSFYDNIQLLIISQAGQWTPAPSNTCLQPKKLNAHFWIMFNIWWWTGLINGLKSHLPSLSSQNNEMLIFVLCSISNYQLGWSMASNPIHHLSPAKIMKCSFLDYFQLLMISWAGQWTQILYTTSLQPKN